MFLYENKSYIEMNQGYFLFSPPREIFPVFCIKGHLLIYGYIKVWPVKNPCDQIYYVKWYSESWLILDTIWDRHILCYKRYIGGWNIVKFIVFGFIVYWNTG